MNPQNVRDEPNSPGTVRESFTHLLCVALLQKLKLPFRGLLIFPGPDFPILWNVRKWDENWYGRTVSDWYTCQPVLPQAVLCDLCAAPPEAVMEAFQAKKLMEEPLKSTAIGAIREVMRNPKAGESNETQTSNEAAA